MVIAGKNKGRRGKILSILREKDRVVVEGVNMVKKTKKRRSQQDQGGIIEIEAALHSSNVQIVCKKCGPTKIGYKIDGDKKTRICRKCKEAL
jgi:large subunit ribosomal protein L24